MIEDMVITYCLDSPMLVAVFPAPGGGNDDLPPTEDGRFLSPGELCVAVSWPNGAMLLFSFDFYINQKAQSANEIDLLNAAKQFLLMRMASLVPDVDFDGLPKERGRHIFSTVDLIEMEEAVSAIEDIAEHANLR